MEFDDPFAAILYVAEMDELDDRSARKAIIALCKMALNKPRRRRGREVVHHIDGNPRNNHPDNLLVVEWSRT